MKTVRNEIAEKAFRSRYNREILCEQGREMNPDGTVRETETLIQSKAGTRYIINEFLENNLTKEAIVSYGDTTRKFNSYLVAEIFIADEIGKES